jgi:hypothetical protein
MSNVVLRNIVGANFRANPEYQLVVFDRLPLEEQQALKDLTKDPDFYGVLVPRSGGTRNAKSVSQDTALLFLTLSIPGPIPAYVQTKLADSCNQTAAELVLDGILEIAHDGRFVYGSEAYEVIYGALPITKTADTLAKLALAALQYAQALDIDDSVRLSARLYFYNRIPLSAQWKNTFPTKEAVVAMLGIDRGGENRRSLDDCWTSLKVLPKQEGWLQWESRAHRRADGTPRQSYKLYVSPQPRFMQKAFRVLVDVLRESKAYHFKVGNDATGVLRPDKMVIYFWDFESLCETAGQISTRLGDCPPQGVPFTACITQDGLLSWGIDPLPEKGALAWQERESWRLWVTNRLAVALLAAKNSKAQALEPWQFALERLRLEKVNIETWAPQAEFGRPVAAEG